MHANRLIRFAFFVAMVVVMATSSLPVIRPLPVAAVDAAALQIDRARSNCAPSMR